MPSNSPTTPLPDVQMLHDARRVDIRRVGVRSLTIPLTVAGAAGPQSTVARVSMTVALSAEHRGTHMSRFVTLLSEFDEPLSLASLRRLFEDMLFLLEAEAGTIEIRCPFFMEKRGPVSGLKSLMDYRVRFLIDGGEEDARAYQEVVVPVTSLCPCSKEISDYGAHNQRSRLVIRLEPDAPVALEEQIRMAENAASCELWSRLKRSDEKYVTEYAYDHPKFVEDLVRDLAIALHRDQRVLSYFVSAENFESIHNHSAYAEISRDKRQPAG